MVLFGCMPAMAQQGELVHFKNGSFVTGNNISKSVFKQDDLQTSLFNDRYFVLIQFSTLPSAQTIQSLKNAGIELGDYFPGQAYLASIKNNFNFSSLKNMGVSSVNALPAFYKIDSRLLTASISNTKEQMQTYAVSFYPSINKAMVQEELKRAGAAIVVTKFADANVIFIQPDKNIVNNIATLPFVSCIQPQTIGDKILNYHSIPLHGMSSLLSPSGRNLSGRGVTVGVGDNGDISTHLDFTGRLINRVYTTPVWHGTHVSGTVAGAGLINPMHHGLAPKAMLVSQTYSDVITNTPTYVTDYNMIATNNSYTDANDGCVGEGAYDATSNYADAQMKNYPTVLHVFAAGNDGNLNCSPYPPFYGTIKSGWQCAKNVLTVGAISQLDYNITNFSSRGPVNDGRLKPEIVASGFNTFSTSYFNLYGPVSGTSMSSPIATGAATILNERYRQLNSGATPKAALIKALLCNTAEDLAPSGPDYTYGFGMLNARKAVEAMEGNQYFISSGTPASHTITVPTGVRRLKVMLYWADPAAAPNAANTLVNDLDLTVTKGATTYQPLVLNPSNVFALAAPGADHTNNIEQVVVTDPVAGNYSLNVSAFSVPQGPQEYVLTYQMEMNGLTVEYPFGGETLVPGEEETLRWTAYGDEGNNFTVEYSTNNGGSWTTIDNNVISTARSLLWTVPATVTNTALIRVSRNASVYTDQSDFNFVILGQPVVNASVPCEGYAQLSWAAIAGATSYDIVQLKGDSMSVIGNTTSLNYLVNGLNPTTSYWFGVIAKNSAINGRRSISVNVIPTTGVCTLSMFNNNFKAVSLDAPTTGRQFTTGALTSTETVKLTIKNLDDVASSGSYDLYYQVNSNTPVMESDATVIASLGSNQFVFTQKADLSAPGVYNIKAWVKRSGDTQPLDDTVSIIVKNLANPPLTLPVSDGFETTTANEYVANTMGLDGDDRVDFKTNDLRGRTRTFVNTGFALNGNRAVTLDQSPYGSPVTDSLLMTFNVNTYNSTNQLRFDFNYKNHGAANNPNNKVWLRGSDTDPWVEAYNLFSNQATLGEWKLGALNVNEILGSAIPPQTVSASFQAKIGQQGNTSANSVNLILDQDDGYTIDDVSLVEAFNDVGITSVVSPSTSGCGMIGAQQVAITVKNYSATSFTDVPAYYRINGGTAHMELIPAIAPNSTQTFLFTVPATLSVDTDYRFDLWISAPGDNYGSNDSINNYSFHSSPLISSFPYLEGFESGAGSWYTRGINDSWEWGTPAKTLINKAANGSKAWVTSLTGTYKTNELSYLYSPCFDLHTLTQPVLSFSHIFDIEDGCPCDYTWIEYSEDGGTTWNRLGVNNGGVNWFNDPYGQSQWGISINKWHVASVNIPSHGTSVRFRFVMSSDPGYNTEGVGIDDIHVFDKEPVYTGATLLNTTQAVSGSNWIHFTSAGKRIASINANGQNLGSTTVDVYPYAGPVRISNNQYYLDRNIVIKPTLPPVGNVSVRFYFTDTEAKNLIAATGCGSCSKPNDPYELGVTKFSGSAAVENGTLADNSPGIYSFILPANTEIIPYDNGYYAEFSVNSFSEFWLNNGGATGLESLPLNLLSFEAVKQNKKALLQWTTDNEVNTSKFIVERSADGRTFQAIGEVVALNRTGVNTYRLTDEQPLAGVNFYRLRLVDKDASYHYSPVRKINFSSTEDDITIYPNPVMRDAKMFIESSANCREAILYDAAGKLVKDYQLKGRDNEIDLFGISRGMYQLKIVTENSVQTKKILIQ